jgi:NADH dehydrogenase
MVHVSAIGADAASASDYARTKALGEAEVLRHMPDAVILRPSIVFGPEDGFFNRFASMARLGPILPVVGGATKFQPVYVEDVAAAAVKGVLGEAAPGIYELGGPEVKTFRALMQQMLTVIHRRRLILGVPFPIAGLMGFVLDTAQAVTVGLFHNGILTRDQVRNLKRDNVVTGQTRTLADLGIEPTALDSVLSSYLWRFRPTGQYDDITDSAKNLRA